MYFCDKQEQQFKTKYTLWKHITTKIDEKALYHKTDRRRRTSTIGF